MKNKIDQMKDIKKWDTIYDEFRKSQEYKYGLSEHLYTTFLQWLPKNYFAPKKKL